MADALTFNDRMLEGPLHPRTLWDVMSKPIPAGGSYGRTDGGGFSATVTNYPAQRKEQGLAELDLVARVALWGLPVMLGVGFGLGFWLGRR